MKDRSPPKTINNSYESPSSGSATSSSSAGDTTTARFMNMDFVNNGYALSSLFLSTSGVSEYNTSMYNTSAEEGIFPNLPSNCPVYAPSYEPEYDYYNQYSTQPLVYSWMPIVPGFSQEKADNLHKFDHIIRKLHPHPLNISNVSAEGNSSIISDQNVKFSTSLVLNSSNTKQFILNNSSGMTFNHHQLEDSCNAMDLNISCNKIQNEKSVNLDLSFNGKFPELTTSSADENIQLNSTTNVKTASPEKCVNIENVATVTDEDESESEKLRNESFELLKQEDDSKMLLINEGEKSPDVTETNCDEDSQDEMESDEQQTTDYQVPGHSMDYSKFNINTDSTVAVETPITKIPTLKDRDDFLFKRFQTSLSELRPPASIATLPLSLSEMIAIYKKNLEKPQESFDSIKSNLMSIPSHPANETMTMEWPQILDVKAHGIMYNRSTDCEQIEFMTVKYVERFIKAETASSYNHKAGPASAKKKIEKLKLLTQSPSSRLSHLANRRKVFSSANLKSSTAASSSSTSHNKTFANSKQLLIDKSKLYQKKKRTSAKKKTPGKRKTPKSAKRQALQLQSKPESAVTSKRALFISPMKSRKDDSSNLMRLTREIPIRGQLPKRTLFSPAQNTKRRRSPEPDEENRYGKTRRLDSPTRLSKSKSFSVAAASSSGSLDEHFRKTLYYRTQSEMVLNQSCEGNKNSSNTIGFKKPFSDTEKKKLLWTASSALQSKQINRDHEKFKEHMSTLCKLVRKIFTEFFNPAKSMSAQMTKFANLMVFYVIQGRSFDDIYLMTKNKLDAQNPTKVSGYIAHEDYQKNHFIRKNSSLLLMSNSCSSLNLAENSDSFLDATFDRSGSDTSLSRSTSKNNESNVLRENFSSNARDNNSTKKLFSGSDSNLNALMKTSTPSSNVLKAKRQISF